MSFVGRLPLCKGLYEDGKLQLFLAEVNVPAVLVPVLLE